MSMLRTGIRRSWLVVLGIALPALVLSSAAGVEIEDLIETQKKIQSLRSAGKYQQALPLAKQLVADAEESFPDHPKVIAHCLIHLAVLYADHSRFAEAERIYKRALALQEKTLGAEHPDVALTLSNLATMYNEQGRYAEAEPLHKRALAIHEKAFDRNHPEVAKSLINLASLYSYQGRNAEAEPLCKRAQAILEKAWGAEHPELAATLGLLANVYSNQGRYAEAEPLYKRALAIREKALGSEHPEVAQILNNLGILYGAQGRYTEAEALHKRALAIREKFLGEEDPDLAESLNNLASLYNLQDRSAEAERMYRRALSIKEKASGNGHPSLAVTLHNLGCLYEDQRRYAEAEPLHKRALEIREKSLGADHPDVAGSLSVVASFYGVQGRYAEAESLFSRAIKIRTKAGVEATYMTSLDYLLRAKLAWLQGRRNEALAGLNRAMSLAEQQRSQYSGGEQERAQAFSRFVGAYELMLEWQTELGDVGAALDALERSRARALLDQMAVAQIDLLAGLPAEQSHPLRAKEAEAHRQLAMIERQLELLRAWNNPPTEDRDKQITLVQEELDAARQAYTDVFATIRNASPAYRQMVGRNVKPASLDEIQARLAGDDRLVLEYFLGVEAGYLLIIPPQGQKARIEKLTLTEVQAKKLGVKAGPLTAAVTKQMMANGEDSGVLQLLRNEHKSAQAADRLAILWRVLVPEQERELIVSDTLKHLIVIPDGSLTLLPFDTLAIEGGRTPRYLLDAGPPVINAPSATVLDNLMRKSAIQASQSKQPVLTVGDPNYQNPFDDAAVGLDGTANDATVGSRYGSLRGTLSNLPNSGLESKWVTEVFGRQGIFASQLTKDSATEANVRHNLANRRIIHLACHGLADQSYGNLFGALAFTPGSRGAANPVDDGFLTLAEIYGLNLQGTELSILSACNTNYGPEQKGEGVWSLSRGFLVAGSRRVVASNWLVDDEAGASLISVFCSDLVKTRADAPQDYAASLQTAKRWVRKQDKWQSPYYWGTFVLVGPN